MITKFLTEYVNENNVLVRDLTKIALRYLHSDFWVDFLLLIPFNAIFEFRYSRIFFFLKTWRIVSVFQIINNKFLMKHIKSYYQRKLNRVLKNDKLKDEINMDLNNINNQIIMNFLVKIIRLIF